MMVISAILLLIVGVTAIFFIVRSRRGRQNTKVYEKDNNIPKSERQLVLAPKSLDQTKMSATVEPEPQTPPIQVESRAEKAAEPSPSLIVPAEPAPIEKDEGELARQGPAETPENAPSLAENAKPHEEEVRVEDQLIPQGNDLQTLDSAEEASNIIENAAPQEEELPVVARPAPKGEDLNARDSAEEEMSLDETARPREEEVHFVAQPEPEGEDLNAQDSAEEENNAEAVGESSQATVSQKKTTPIDSYEGSPTEEIPPSPEPRRISPEKRGGRSRATIKEDEPKKTATSRRRTPKPEIVCWNRAREWLLGVEMPEELLEVPGLSVVQNGRPLVEGNEGCRLLVGTRGQVVVRTSEADPESEIKIELGEDDRLVFKLSGTGMNQGRRVKRPSCGSYLVIAPQNFKRCEEKAGKADHSPEAVCLEGYRAHFFRLEGNHTVPIAFRDQSGDLPPLTSIESRFQLVGHELHDASENMGPLFGGPPPRLRAVDGNWTDVGTIVLGAEGSGRGRWRISFKPHPALSEQDLPDEIVRRKAGWYFARFYDLQDELIESLDFRFVSALHEIIIPKSVPFPSPTGHGEIAVEFRHDADCCVDSPAAKPNDLKITHAVEKTILTIPKAQECDRTNWSVGPCDGKKVDVGILLPRVWWALGDASNKFSHWKDECLSLCQEDFRATSENALWIQFPKPGWADSVFVGFKQDKSRRYQPKVAESVLAIQLRDFSDSQELADRTKDHFLKVWVELENTFFDASVATIPAEIAEGPLDVTQISACHVAGVLTTLKNATRGPERRLFKEIRCQYRRPQGSPTSQNDEFVKESLCAIAIFLQPPKTGFPAIPKSVNRWARLARREFPEAWRQVWRRYRELENEPTPGIRGNLINRRKT